MDKKKLMLAAFRKMAAGDAKRDMTPEPQLKPVKGEGQVQFEMLKKMLSREKEDTNEEDLKRLSELR